MYNVQQRRALARRVYTPREPMDIGTAVGLGLLIGAAALGALYALFYGEAVALDHIHAIFTKH